MVVEIFQVVIITPIRRIQTMMHIHNREDIEVAHLTRNRIRMITIVLNMLIQPLMHIRNQGDIQVEQLLMSQDVAGGAKVLIDDGKKWCIREHDQQT